MSLASNREASSRQSAIPVLSSGRRVLEMEARAIEAISGRLDHSFETAVEQILACRGRVIVTGMGKSGQICRKIAATFASTGTASFFVHAGEASHGDLGMLARGDVCMTVSNSGKTHEILDLLPAIKRLHLPLIAMTGSPSSPLAEAANIVLDIGVAEEACPLGLAPTASTTVTLALGDALAVAVLEQKGFSERDFALLHPGGVLGHKLLRVCDIMHADRFVPRVAADLDMHETLKIMTEGGFGVVAVVDPQGRLLGVVTDGDLRRGMLKHKSLRGLCTREVMTTQPKTVEATALAAEALALMEEHSITALFIVNPASGVPVGIIHLHDLLRAGVA